MRTKTEKPYVGKTIKSQEYFKITTCGDEVEMFIDESIKKYELESIMSSKTTKIYKLQKSDLMELVEMISEDLNTYNKSDEFSDIIEIVKSAFSKKKKIYLFERVEEERCEFHIISASLLRANDLLIR